MTYKNQEIASRGERFVGYLINKVLPFVFFIPFSIIFVSLFVSDFLHTASIIVGPHLVLTRASIFLIAFIIMIGCYIILINNRSQNFGHLIMDLIVVDADTLEPINPAKFIFKRALLGKFLIFGAIPYFGLALWPYFLVDAILIFFDDTNQTIHDRLANTVVLKLPEKYRMQHIFDYKKIPKDVFKSSVKEIKNKTTKSKATKAATTTKVNKNKVNTKK